MTSDGRTISHAGATMRKGFIAGQLGVTLLGIGALAAPVIARDSMPRPWDDGRCELQWCSTATPTPSDSFSNALDEALHRAVRIAELADGRDCVQDARPGAIPSGAVVADERDGALRWVGSFDRVWKLTHNERLDDDVWVLRWCYGSR